MALGLVHGRFDPAQGSLEEHRKHLWDTYSLYNQLPQRFVEKYGSLQCWDLTQPHVYGTKKCRDFCEELIAETAGMVMELLIEAEEKGLRFPFHRNLLSQAAEVTGLTPEELIKLKAKGRTFSGFLIAASGSLSLTSSGFNFLRGRLGPGRGTAARFAKAPAGILTFLGVTQRVSAKKGGRPVAPASSKGKTTASWFCEARRHPRVPVGSFEGFDLLMFSQK